MMKWYGELQLLKPRETPKREEVTVEVQHITMPEIVTPPPIKVIEE
jgi:hypothetical protein